MNADDERKGADRGQGGPSAGSDIDARMAALRKKLDTGKRDGAGQTGLRDNSGMAMALKLGSEFVAGVIVGFVIGYGFDWLLGTSPWGMIVFLLLGFAAGTLNLLRSAGLLAPSKFETGGRGDGE